MLTDHKNLIYFTTSRTLNRRQARWSSFLADYDFEILFRPGVQHGKADALSRCPDFALRPGDDAYSQQSHCLLRPDQLQMFATATTSDPFAKEIMARINDPSPGMKSSYLNQFTTRDGLLYRNHLLYVPEGSCRTRVLQNCHDDPLAGHFGVTKTLELLSRGFWWPQPWKFVKEFIKTCDVCARSKTPHHRPYGLLHPLPIPSRPWVSLSMDFITDLPLVGGYDTVLVIVDRFSKMAHFVPCSKTISGEETTDLFLKNVVQLHGLPEDITFDRGFQFISHFWRRLLGAQPTTLPSCSPLVIFHHHHLPKTPRATFDLQTETVPSLWTTVLSMLSVATLPLLFVVIVSLLLSYITH